MQWSIHHGDILETRADILVCSANPYLTLSGGVGGSFLLRYGDQMQQRLVEHLRSRGVSKVERGSVVEMPPCGSPHRAVLHAVAVDGGYATSIEIVTDVLRKVLRIAAHHQARSIAIPALATGYGPLSTDQLIDAVLLVTREAFPPVEHAMVWLRKQDQAQQARARLEAR